MLSYSYHYSYGHCQIPLYKASPGASTHILNHTSPGHLRVLPAAAIVPAALTQCCINMRLLPIWRMAVLFVC
jgi:hypothetical protein